MKYLNYFISMLVLLTPTTISASSVIELEDFVRSAEEKYELPKGLLGAVIFVESAGSIHAFVKHDGKSQQSSFGLMQIQLGTARFIQRYKAENLGVKLNKKELVTAKDLMKPEVNIEYGAAYLRWLIDQKHGDYAKALTCYNTGIAGALCTSKFYSTYAGKVLNAMIRGMHK